MTTLLRLALLLAIFLDLVAASSPVLDPTLPAAPMDSLYNDPDGLLDPFCQMCGMLSYQCACVVFVPPQRAPTFTVDMFTAHEEWPQDPMPVFDEHVQPTPSPPEPEPEPEPYFAEPARQPLTEPHVRKFNENATTVQPVSVQAHVDSLYNVGDRVEPVKQTLARKISGKRQPPNPGGFACSNGGCKRLFDRKCDLNRHAKTHLGSGERPHKCTVCREGFQYPKDLLRHRSVHSDTSSTRALLRCHVPNCANQGFSRRDNLLRHLRKQHPDFVAA